MAALPASPESIPALVCISRDWIGALNNTGATWTDSISRPVILATVTILSVLDGLSVWQLPEGDYSMAWL